MFKAIWGRIGTDRVGYPTHRPLDLRSSGPSPIYPVLPVAVVVETVHRRYQIAGISSASAPTARRRRQTRGGTRH